MAEAEGKIKVKMFGTEIYVPVRVNYVTTGEADPEHIDGTMEDCREGSDAAHELAFTFLFTIAGAPHIGFTAELAQDEYDQLYAIVREDHACE